MSRPLINAIVMGFAIFTLGCGIGTQVAAHLLGYHSALGDPLLTISGVPIFWPFAVFDWRADAPETIEHLFRWPMICAFGRAVVGESV
jgi:hypothetical protein